MNARLIPVMLALLAGCSSSTSPSTTPGVDVSIQPGAAAKTTDAFAPSPFTVSLSSGGIVHWRNGDVGSSGDAYGNGATPGTTHDIASDTPGLFDSGSLAPGALFQHTFAVAGTYHYHCAIHPTMTGIIVVN